MVFLAMGVLLWVKSSWSNGVLEYWVRNPAFHHSSAPLLQPESFYRVPFRHLVEKTFFLKFLQKTQVDELLGLEVLGLGQGRRQHVEHELNTFERRVGLFRNRLGVAVIGVLEHVGIVGAHVFRENALGLLLVGIDEIDRLDEALEGVFHGVAVACDVSARG